MARKADTTQDEPTRPQPVDGDGYVLDGWGLPLSGPARARRLADLGKPDPRCEPDAWSAPAPSSPATQD